MAYTKRFFIQQAFTEIGLAEYVFDPQPEQFQSALTRLDSQMATWDSMGIRVGWSIPNAENQSTLDDAVDVPYYAREAIYLQLGLRICPMFGKTPSPDLKSSADKAFSALVRENAQPVPMQFPNTLPSGAGNKPWRTLDNPFLGAPTDFIQAGSESPIDFGTLPTNNGAQP